jgi:hypothetical protein
LDLLFIITEKPRTQGVRKVQCDGGVMKDKEVKMEEIESSHTLVGPGEGRVHGESKISDVLFYYESRTVKDKTYHGEGSVR